MVTLRLVKSEVGPRTPESVAVSPPDEGLLTAEDVARYLRIPTKKVYRLPLQQVRLSPRRVRYLLTDVKAYITSHRAVA